jgi:hypothetical protein
MQDKHPGEKHMGRRASKHIKSNFLVVGGVCKQRLRTL